MPKIPKLDHSVANFGKHKGKTWEEVATEDPSYINWLLSYDCPVTLANQLYVHLQEIAEEHGL